MLTDVCDDDRIVLCELVELFDDHGTGQPVFVVEKRIFGLHLANLLHPLVVVLRHELFVEIVQDILQVSDDGLMHFDILIDLCGIDINVDDLGAGRKLIGISDHAVRKARAHRNQKVAFTDAEIGSLGAVHTDHAGIVGIMPVKSTFSHQCVAHGCINEFHKFLELFAGPGDHSAAAHIEEGAFGGFDHFDHVVDVGIAVTASLSLQSFGRGGSGDVLGHCAGHILGNIDQNRAGSAGCGDPEGLADRRREVLDILDDVAMLGDRHGDTRDIDLLERILAKKRQGYVARDGDKRNAVHIRGGDSCHEIGGAGTAGREADAYFAGCSRIAVRHVGSALLVRGKIMGDLVSVFV